MRRPPPLGLGGHSEVAMGKQSFKNQGSISESIAWSSQRRREAGNETFPRVKQQSSGSSNDLLVSYFLIWFPSATLPWGPGHSNPRSPACHKTRIQFLWPQLFLRTFRSTCGIERVQGASRRDFDSGSVDEAGTLCVQ